MSQVILDFRKIEMCYELTSTQRVLIKKIHLLSKNTGYCYASNEGLAKMMAMSGSGISKVVSRLVKLGFIERVVIKENGNERHIRLTKKCIDMFKKVLKHKQDQKPSEQPKPQDQKPSEQPKPQGQNDVNNELSEINNNLFVSKYGQPSEIIIQLEKIHGKFDFNSVLMRSLKSEIENVEAYFIKSLTNNKLNKSVSDVKPGVNIKRKEIKPDYVDENNRAWDNYFSEQKKQDEEKRKNNATNNNKQIGGSYGMPIWNVGGIA